eukprot:TRINITY_DN2284_c0_g2_i2.p1 TRINITY_DN2284_c0_g2~~TRINITY_DN2284_c0_g2_i2.p1  ORF type:complete len:575 (+),score=143.84 TRINITY_DN2284_c0_g2_i2:133-1725(+)
MTPAEQSRALSIVLQRHNIMHSPCYAAIKREQRRPQQPPPLGAAPSDDELSTSSGQSSLSSPSPSESEGESDEAPQEQPTTEFLDPQDSDGSDSKFLMETPILTEEELIRRRRQKIRHLLRYYQSQFRRLRDVLRVKHRRYFLRRQRILQERAAAFAAADARSREEELKSQRPRKRRDTSRPVAPGVPGYGTAVDVTSPHVLMPGQHPLLMGAGAAPGAAVFPTADPARKGAAAAVVAAAAAAAGAVGVQHKLCLAPGCTARCIPPSVYCFAHLLQDPKQKLFKACQYQSGGGPTCSHPILISQVPPLCPLHMDAGAGVGVVGPAPGAPPPAKRPAPAVAATAATASPAMSPAATTAAAAPAAASPPQAGNAPMVPVKRRRIPEEGAPEPSPSGDFPAQLVYGKINDLVQCIQTKRHRLIEQERQRQQSLHAAAAAPPVMMPFNQQLQLSALLAGSAAGSSPQHQPMPAPTHMAAVAGGGSRTPGRVAIPGQFSQVEDLPFVNFVMHQQPQGHPAAAVVAVQQPAPAPHL